MIFVSKDIDIEMVCGGCRKPRPVQVLAIGTPEKAEFVIPICDECRRELVHQAMSPSRAVQPKRPKLARIK